MQKTIEVNYSPATGFISEIVVPVNYKIVIDSIACTKTIHCDIDLPLRNWLAWLRPTSFEIISRELSGMHVTNYNDRTVGSIDAGFFRYKVFEAIMFRDKLMMATGIEGC